MSDLSNHSRYNILPVEVARMRSDDASWVPKKMDRGEQAGGRQIDG